MRFFFKSLLPSLQTVVNKQTNWLNYVVPLKIQIPVTGRHILIPGLFFAPGLQYYIMTLQRTRPIIEEAGFEPGTSLPLVV